MKKRVTALMILLAMLLSGAASGASAGEAQQIPVAFWVFGDHVYTDFTFPYSDEWFLAGDGEFSPELAQGSLGLAFSAFRGKENVLSENQYASYLTAAGFEDLHPFGYDEPTGTDTFSGILARKKIGDFTLIAAAGCGQGYVKEWGGNFRVGNGPRHEGFDLARGILADELDRYLAENPADGPVKLWVTGYSRSAAVANLAAADWTESGRFDAVYAYCFACPRNTREPADCPNIFNICCAQDPMTQIPMESYGFMRNGKDLYLPSRETAPGFPGMKAAASETAVRLTGKPLFSNASVNLDLRLGIGLLCRIFPVLEEFTEQYQNLIVAEADDAAADTSEEEIVPAMLLEMLKAEIREDGSEFLSTALAMAGSSLYRYTGSRMARQVEAGSWDPDDLVSVNLFREHMPTTYTAWLFSGLPAEELYRPEAGERILFLHRCESLTVLRGEEAVWDMKENSIRPLTDDAPGVLVTGPDMAVLTLPAEEDYRVEFTPKNGSVKALEVMLSPARTLCDRCTCLAAAEGEQGPFTLTLPAGEPAAGEGMQQAEAPCGAEDLILLKSFGFYAGNIRDLFDGLSGQ